MNNPFFVWYFQIYELSAAYWLNAWSTVGRYPPVRSKRETLSQPVGSESGRQK